VRSRCLPLVFGLLVVAACGQTPGPTAPATPGATRAPSASASPTPTVIPTGVVPSAPPAVDEATLTLICRSDYDGGVAPSKLTRWDVCTGILTAGLAALGPRARDVARIEAGLVCEGCTDTVIVGFKDGHLEGAHVYWQGEVAPYAVAPFHAVDASVWPWGYAATFSPPPASSPTLAIHASAEVAALSPLPFCGLDNLATQDRAIRYCFANAVLTGHPAEFVSQEEDLGATFAHIYRFTGSGPVLIYDGIGTAAAADWFRAHGIVYIGKSGWADVDFLEKAD